MATAAHSLASSLRTRASHIFRQARLRPLIRLAAMMVTLLIPTYLLLTLLLPPPATPSKTPLLSLDFADPCIIQDAPSGTWYAFASGGWWTTPNTTTTTPAEATYKNIQAASAPSPSGPWTYLPSADPLPSPGRWATSTQTWAPSVIQLNSSSSYVLYYAAQLAGNHSSSYHCIGAATSQGSVLGPYTPLPEPLICPLDKGGAIDPAGFLDPVTGRRYLVYKVDGNAMGAGGECNNGVEPFQQTPIVLQEVDTGDGVGLVGEGVEVFDRDGGVDGPLVEAPDLFFFTNTMTTAAGAGRGEGGRGEAEVTGEGGRYVLFYSNHCWDGPGYSVNYAVAEGNVTGPYKRGTERLIGTGDGFNVTAPGGAASVPGGGWMVFHGDCPQGRCLFGAEMEVVGGTVVVS